MLKLHTNNYSLCLTILLGAWRDRRDLRHHKVGGVGGKSGMDRIGKELAKRLKNLPRTYIFIDNINHFFPQRDA